MPPGAINRELPGLYICQWRLAGATHLMPPTVQRGGRRPCRQAESEHPHDRRAREERRMFPVSRVIH